MLGLSTTAYGDIERGKTDLTLTRLSQIAHVLRVESAELLSGPDQETRAIEAIPTASPDMQHLQFLLEKQKLEMEKLRLEAETWKRRYEERIALELIRAIGSQTTTSRERIGF